VDPRVRLLVTMIEEKKGTVQFSSKEAGKLLGLGEAHLLRLFSLEVGNTFRRYLRDVRMSRAAELVRGTLLPMKTIAERCGYTDVSNFYRDFKQVYHLTPMRMRLIQMAATRVQDQRMPGAEPRSA
jgi:AraC-like DNA-binding protein